MQVAGREVTIEHRGRYGWFILEKGQTLFGFQTRRLLNQYLDKVKQAGKWHTPVARECYR